MWAAPPGSPTPVLGSGVAVSHAQHLLPWGLNSLQPGGGQRTSMVGLRHSSYSWPDRAPRKRPAAGAEPGEKSLCAQGVGDGDLLVPLGWACPL